MFKVPFYTFDNYLSILDTSHHLVNGYERVELKCFLQLMDNEFVQRYANWDVRKLGEYLDTIGGDETIMFAWSTRKLRDVVIAVKLLMPTLWTCDYFFWDEEQGTHTGIDIIMPQGTPIASISEWKVVRIKERDGQKKDEWNCVVIQSWNLCYSYKHLDTIAVKYGQDITRSMLIGTCGSTGMSTQFHLHFQVDTPQAAFHPYWSNQLWNILKYTENPLNILKKHLMYKTIFEDLPWGECGEAIEYLYDQGIVKWHHNNVFPLAQITRWESALVVHRLAKKYGLFRQLPVIHHNYVPYVDVEYADPELQEALEDLKRYGIMEWHQNQFFPDEYLKWEQWLAILWRLFFRLKNSEVEDEWNWYDSYKLYFQVKKIIDWDWKYWGAALERKEVFLVTYKVLKYKYNL